LHCETDAQFVVHVMASVGNASNRLLIDLDGRRVVERAFPAGKGQGKSSRYIAQYENWFCEYDEEAIVDLPKGPHEVRLDAAGKDRIEVELLLRNYMALEDANPLRIWGRATADGAYFWAQSRLSTWYALYRKQPLIPLARMQATFAGLKDGEYQVEWWDTWAGKALQHDAARCVNGELTVSLPTLTRDIAGKARRK
jgi:hypothetical protein